MKRNVIILSLALLGVGMVGCHEDHLNPKPSENPKPGEEHEEPAPVQKSAANFTKTELSVSEKSTQTIGIRLSEKLMAPGSITLSLQSASAEYGTHFTTTPSLANGTLELTLSTGADSASFSISPIDNNHISGELSLKVSIVATSGSIASGAQLQQSITITDDELQGKPRGYRTTSGGWNMSKELTYNEDGRIAFIKTTTSTPTTSTNVQTYSYDDAGRIQKISDGDTETTFTWSLTKITRSDTRYMGTAKSYSEFYYDAQGNVARAANYFRQPDGSFLMSFENRYEYFADGNLKTSQTFISASNELKLIATRTFDQYIDVANPFPTIDIHPAFQTQKGLPRTYTVRDNGVAIDYTMSYEFDKNGSVIKRTTTSTQASETAFYTYY